MYLLYNYLVYWMLVFFHIPNQTDLIPGPSQIMSFPFY